MRSMKQISLYIGLVLLIAFPMSASSASLRLEANKTSLSGTSDEARINVVLDTEGQNVQANDIIIQFDDSIFTVIDEDSGTSGIQIDNETPFSVEILNEVVGNLIKISHGVVVPGSFNDEDIIAQFRVRANRSGNGDFVFAYTSGATDDSNVASAGTDILSSVSGLSISATVSSGSSGGGSSSSGGSSGSSSSSSAGGSSQQTTPTQNQTGARLLALNTPIAISLYRGLSNGAVANLQRMLIAEGHLGAGNDTGFFGPLTERAVQLFQAREGIVSGGTPATTGYGVVGPLTRAYINARIGGTTSGNTGTNVTVPVIQQPVTNVPVQSSAGGYYRIGNVERRTLSLGDEGFDVKALQRFLNLAGFTVSGSGPGSLGNETEYFGPATHNAIIRFQNAYRNQILAPVGLSNGSGIVGPSTWSHIENIR